MQPVRPIEAVPWGWNPGQTFVTAFNESRLTKAKADQLQMEAELEQLLFPVAQKKAALELDKMQFEVERQSLMLDMARDAQRQAHRAQMSGLKGSSGSGSTVQGSGNNAQGFQSQFGFGRGLSQPSQAPAKKLSWQVVAPAQPNPQGP